MKVKSESKKQCWGKMSGKEKLYVRGGEGIPLPYLSSGIMQQLMALTAFSSKAF